MLFWIRRRYRRRLSIRVIELVSKSSSEWVVEWVSEWMSGWIIGWLLMNSSLQILIRNGTIGIPVPSLPSILELRGLFLYSSFQINSITTRTTNDHDISVHCWKHVHTFFLFRLSVNGNNNIQSFNVGHKGDKFVEIVINNNPDKWAAVYCWGGVVTLGIIVAMTSVR